MVTACLRRPGALHLPVPPTGKVPAPGAVSSFLLRKNLKTGVIIYEFIGSSGSTCHRRLPDRGQRTKCPCRRRHFVRVAPGCRRCDCKSGRAAHKVCRPTGRTDLQRQAFFTRFALGCVYQFIGLINETPPRDVTDRSRILSFTVFASSQTTSAPPVRRRRPRR